MPHKPAAGRRMTPVGHLIEAARVNKGISQNVAASLVIREVGVGFTGTRWRHVIQGRRGNSNHLVHPSADVLARMAYAVDLHPDDLEIIDPDAADALRDLIFDLDTADRRRPRIRPRSWLRDLAAQEPHEGDADEPDVDEPIRLDLRQAVAMLKADLRQLQEMTDEKTYRETLKFLSLSLSPLETEVQEP